MEEPGGLVSRGNLAQRMGKKEAKEQLFIINK